MKYQVGDKVQIKGYPGSVATIIHIDSDGFYHLDIDILENRWSEEMFEETKDLMLEDLSECCREIKQKDMETNKTGGFLQTESSDYRNEVPGGFFGQQGWICPKCGRVYSPFTAMCPYCKGGFEQKVTAQGLNTE